MQLHRFSRNRGSLYRRLKLDAILQLLEFKFYRWEFSRKENILRENSAQQIPKNNIKFEVYSEYLMYVLSSIQEGKNKRGLLIGIKLLRY